MAITGNALLINLRYTFLGQKCQTGQYYRPEGVAFLEVNCDAVGEAWWQDVKVRWRDLISPAVSLFSFDSVLVEEFNGSGGLGEFAIPVGEREGTRDPDPGGTFMPSYAAVGVRLSVPTRVTRPGQKRFPGLLEADVNQNDVEADFLALVESLAVVYSEAITLGAPVALGTLTPIIIKREPDAPYAELARQDVVGHVVNGKITSQVSRRYGHGS